MNNGYIKDTSIIMHDCTIKKIQDIKVGDKVMCADSSIGIVKLIKMGTAEMFDIIPTRGNKYTVANDQIIVLKTSNYERRHFDESRNRYQLYWVENFTIKCKSFPVKESKDQTFNLTNEYFLNTASKSHGYTKYGDIIEIKANDYYNLNIRIRDIYKGYSVGINFNETPITIDGYALGYWLGDGHTDGTAITTIDQEVKDYYKAFSKNLGLQVTLKGKYSFDITSGNKNSKVGSNPWRNFLKDNNLLGDKHIPNSYKYNSKEIRLSVLAGLIDSDGYNGSNTYDFCLKCEKLVDDIIFLARSLGFYVSGKKKVQKTCTNSKNGPKTADYFRFHICGERLDEIPVLLKRKKAHQRLSKKNSCVNGIKIVPIGQNTFYGFELEESKRILLGDFTVSKA